MPPASAAGAHRTPAFSQPCASCVGCRRAQNARLFTTLCLLRRLPARTERPPFHNLVPPASAAGAHRTPAFSQPCASCVGCRRAQNARLFTTLCLLRRLPARTERPPFHNLVPPASAAGAHRTPAFSQPCASCVGCRRAQNARLFTTLCLLRRLPARTERPPFHNLVPPASAAGAHRTPAFSQPCASCVGCRRAQNARLFTTLCLLRRLPARTERPPFHNLVPPASAAGAHRTPAFSQPCASCVGCRRAQNARLFTTLCLLRRLPARTERPPFHNLVPPASAAGAHRTPAFSQPCASCVGCRRAQNARLFTTLCLLRRLPARTERPPFHNLVPPASAAGAHRTPAFSQPCASCVGCRRAQNARLFTTLCLLRRLPARTERPPFHNLVPPASAAGAHRTPAFSQPCASCVGCRRAQNARLFTTLCLLRRLPARTERPPFHNLVPPASAAGAHRTPAFSQPCASCVGCRRAQNARLFTTLCLLRRLPARTERPPFHNLVPPASAAGAHRTPAFSQPCASCVGCRRAQNARLFTTLCLLRRLPARTERPPFHNLVPPASAAGAHRTPAFSQPCASCVGCRRAQNARLFTTLCLLRRLPARTERPPFHNLVPPASAAGAHRTPAFSQPCASCVGCRRAQNARLFTTLCLLRRLPARTERPPFHNLVPPASAAGAHRTPAFSQPCASCVGCRRAKNARLFKTLCLLRRLPARKERTPFQNLVPPSSAAGAQKTHAFSKPCASFVGCRRAKNARLFKTLSLLRRLPARKARLFKTLSLLRRLPARKKRTPTQNLKPPSSAAGAQRTHAYTKPSPSFVGCRRAKNARLFKPLCLLRRLPARTYRTPFQTLVPPSSAAGAHLPHAFSNPCASFVGCRRAPTARLFKPLCLLRRLPARTYRTPFQTLVPPSSAAGAHLPHAFSNPCASFVGCRRAPTARLFKPLCLLRRLPARTYRTPFQTLVPPSSAAGAHLPHAFSNPCASFVGCRRAPTARLFKPLCLLRRLPARTYRTPFQTLVPPSSAAGAHLPHAFSNPCASFVGCRRAPTARLFKPLCLLRRLPARTYRTPFQTLVPPSSAAGAQRTLAFSKP